MSEENVQIVKALVERFNHGDGAAVDDLYDANAVYHFRMDEADAHDYHGLEALEEQRRLWRDVFEDFGAEVDEYVDAGEFVVATGWWSGHIRDTGAEVREPYAWAMRVTGGKVVEVYECRTKDKVLEAAGLSE